ncbi:MAG: hypothetical protein KJ593_07345 [Candidatus Omnitrophica bacterium]|nr:hypothetical protein [Candidatus Omnitrophota bacterium]
MGTKIKKQKYHQVSFMPWADFKDELQIGPVLFWSFTNADTKIKNQSLLKHLTRYFSSYVDHQGKAVDTIVVCSYKKNNFRCLSKKEYSDLRDAVNMLTFCAIAPTVKNAVCANNRSMGPSSSEVFQLITQNFIPGNNHIAVRAGNLLSGGWEMGEVTFPKPWSTGGFFKSPNEELMSGFNKMFENNVSVEVRERIFRSLEWFRLSHVQNEDVSFLSKIVMMATAFEILLQVPNVPNKKGWIAEKLDEQVKCSEFIKLTRTDNKGKKHRCSKLYWWAWDFYNLRNSIVHGEHIEPKLQRYHVSDKKWINYHIVADLVFLECVKRELFNMGCIGDNARDCAKKWDESFPDEKDESATQLLAEWFLGIKDVYRAMGWLRKNKKYSTKR